MVRASPRSLRKRAFRRLLLALLALASLTGFGAAILRLGQDYLNVREVAVPEVRGLEASAAQAQLEALGFEVSTYTESAAAGAPGTVSAQTPEPATLVRRGRDVALGVSAPTTITVPTLTGLTQAEAEAVLERANVPQAELRFKRSPAPAGTVLEQVPAPGQVLGDRTPLLTLSLGQAPQRVVMPRLVGRPVAAAQAQLERLGFRRIELVPTALGPSRVTAQQPRAGAQTLVSAPVTLYYTLQNRQVVAVPDVVGLTLEQASRRLEAAGLRIGSVNEAAFDPDAPRGVSAAQPGGYTLWGTAVTLSTNGNAGTFERANPALPAREPADRNRAAATPPTGQVPEGGRTIPISYDPKNYSFLQGRPFEFRVDVTDAQGSRTVLNRSVRADEAIDDSVVVYGEAELRMYIDGQIVLAYNPPLP